MGKSMNRNDSYSDSMYDPLSVPMSPALTPNSPLDLSINSKRFPFNPLPTAPVDLSSKSGSIFTGQMSVDPFYNPPTILIEPKSKWHYRSLKDLANKHLPLLPGDGRQRTPIRVSVPEAYEVPLYLNISILTMKEYAHPSKVIVPAGTTVRSTHIAHDNDLNCLQFDENATDHVDLNRRCIFAKISADEHRARTKDIRIHMFNLYQSQIITKELIEAEELNRCKLSFQLCILQDGQYIPVSRPSFSVTIEEKKMTSRPRASDQIGTSLVAPSRSSEAGSYQDNTYEDDSY